MHNYMIKAIEDLARATTYLVRPWKPLSRTIYMESFMDNIIHEANRHLWDSDKEKDLNTLYVGEYKNSGLCSSTSHRVTWKGYHVIDSSIASKFIVSKFLSGDSWLPLTSVSPTLVTCLTPDYTSFSFLKPLYQ
ncbi:hypothetical protein K1719_026111 [Acacia pycnantha]|nr:hypothetical protein K1719_026111 [Acacia pycnantha]